MFDIEILYDDKQRYEQAKDLFKEEIGDEYDYGDCMQRCRIESIDMWLKHYRNDTPLEWDLIVQTVKNYVQDYKESYDELYALHFGSNDNQTLTTSQNPEGQV